MNRRGVSTKTHRSSLLVTFVLLACRAGPTPEDATVAQAVPQLAPETAQGAEVFDDPFVFSIDGMRKINGAL